MKIHNELARIVSPAFGPDYAKELAPKIKRQAKALGVSPADHVMNKLSVACIPTDRKRDGRVVRVVPNAKQVKQIVAAVEKALYR